MTAGILSAPGARVVDNPATSLLIAASRATRELLTSPDMIAALPQALQLIGEAANMDRLLVLLETQAADGRLVHRVFREWVAPGIATHESVQLGDLANDDFPELVERLHSGDGFWMTVGDLNEGSGRKFEALGILTTTGFPIFAGGRYAGLLAFDDCRTIRRYEAALAEALQAAAQVIAAAMERELLIERAARDRLAELNTSTSVLQASIDALRETENLDAFVPRVLEMVGESFRASSCGLYESAPSGTTWLRYWTVDGKTLLPAELTQLDPDKYALIRFLADGFEVSDEYLGGPLSQVLHAVVLNHLNGTSVPEFDAFAKGIGADWELNVPVAAGGLRAFTLCVYRARHGNPFSEPEIALAVALAKQLGLAMEASRLSQQAKAAAIAQEQQRQVREQVEVLMRSNDALRQGVDRVAQGDRLDGLLEGLLLGSMSVTGAAGGAITLWQDGRYAGTQCVAQDGAIVPFEQWSAEPFFQETPAFLGQDADGFTSSLLRAPYTRSTLEWSNEFWPAAAAYHGKRGHIEVWNVPCLSRGCLLASLGLAFRKPLDGGPVLTGTLTALAQQTALGLELARHTEQEKEAALVREREASAARERLEAARSRAEELAKAHGVLRQTSERLTTLDDLNGFLEQIVRSAVEGSGGVGGGIGLLEGDALRIAARVDDSGPQGTLVRPSQRPDVVRLEGQVRAAWVQAAAHEGYWWASPDDPGFIGQFRQYHRARGHRRIAHIRMVIRDEVIGFLAIAFREEERPSAPRLEMFRVLAQQASLAIALTRLAAEASDAAVSRDRETHAKRTSEFLTQTIIGLSSGADLRAALASVMEQLARAIDAAHLFLLRHNPDDGTLQLQLAFVDGRIRWGPSGEELPLWAHAFPDDITPAWRIMCDHRGLFTPESSMPIPVEKFAWPGAAEYASRFQLSDMAHLVLFAGETAVGSLGFGFRGGRRIQPADRHFIESASHQATIVIRMLDLSEEAQRGAVAREREVASERRALELARTNDALRRTLDAVAFQPALDDVLDKVLSAIVEQLECASCALWMRDRNSGHFQIRLVFHDGQVWKSGPEFERYLKGSWGGGRGLTLTEHIQERKPVVYQVREIKEGHSHAREFLQNLGVHTLLGVPLILGREIIGSLTARFHTPRELSAEELELAQVMSHQATLAIELTRMAGQAGDAALSEERARFAREIHDTLAQGFTGILMQMGAASQVAGTLRSEIAPQLEAVTSLARTSLAEARRSVRALRPLATNECQLDRTVEQSIESARLQTKAEVVFRMKGARGELSPHVEKELCRIVQESLNNAVKHSSAKRIAVSVEFQGAQAVRLSVKDDGVGFDPSLRPGVDSFGLIGMQERASSIGASLTVISEPDWGAEVIVQYGKGGTL